MNKLLYLFLSSLVKIVGSLPLGFRTRLGATLGFCVSLVPSRDRQIAQEQISYFLKPESPKSLVRKVYSHLGATLAESLNLNPILKDIDARIHCETLDKILSWQQDGRAIVALTGHLGNWDLLAAYMIAKGFKVNTIGRKARSPALQQLLSKLRDSYGVVTLWRDESSSIRKMMSILKSAGVIAALIDQDTEVASVQIPFFGTPASTPSGLVTMAQRSNARIVSVFLLRDSYGSYHVDLREIDESGSVEAILGAYSAHLEELIREAPQQWVWVHKRWRSRPDGTRLRSREYLQKLSEGTI